MPMKQHLILALAVVILAGLAIFSVDAYHNRPQPKPAETTQQAVAAQKAADAAVLLKDNQANTVQLNSASVALTNMTTNRNTVCVQLKSIKLTNPACN